MTALHAELSVRPQQQGEVHCHLLGRADGFRGDRAGCGSLHSAVSLQLDLLCSSMPRADYASHVLRRQGQGRSVRQAGVVIAPSSSSLSLSVDTPILSVPSSAAIPTRETTGGYREADYLFDKLREPNAVTSKPHPFNVLRTFLTMPLTPA